MEEIKKLPNVSEMQLEWAWRAERVDYEGYSEVYSIWRGTDQRGRKVKVYIRKIEFEDDSAT